MTQQLVKRTVHGGYSNVMPKSWIEGIKEKSTGRALKEILQSFNMYFLSYTGNEATTRQSVPSILRKRGLWITYVDYKNNIHTEYYNSDDIDDESFGDSSNWNIGNNSLVGDISISANGNWVINGEETNFKAQGEAGITPIFRFLTDGSETLQVSYNKGEGWEDVVKFTNNLRISRYIGADEPLPTSGVAEGTIYMKGPHYDENDTLNDNPIYRMWIYAWKGNTLAWQDNGEFQSIPAGIVQETGDNENTVMSQKAVTDSLNTVIKAITENNQALGARLDIEGTQVMTVDEMINFNPIANEGSSYLAGYLDKPSRYVVTKEVDGVPVNVGILEILSDSSQHVYTQVFTTHFSLDNSGNLELGAHVDTKLFTYFRSFSIDSPLIDSGTWTKWEDISHYSDILESIAKNTKDIELLNANTGVYEYPEFSEATAYSVGDIVRYEGLMYRFISEHAAGAWDVSQVEDWSERKEVGKNLTDLKSIIGYNIQGQGTTQYGYTDLNTPIRTNSTVLNLGDKLVYLRDASKENFVRLGGGQKVTLAFDCYAIQSSEENQIYNLRILGFQDSVGAVIAEIKGSTTNPFDISSYSVGTKFIVYSDFSPTLIYREDHDGTRTLAGYIRANTFAKTFVFEKQEGDAKIFIWQEGETHESFIIQYDYLVYLLNELKPYVENTSILLDKKITPADIQGIVGPINLFDAKTAMPGYLADESTITDNVDYITSDYIGVDSNAEYSLRGHRFIAQYDSYKKALSYKDYKETGISQITTLPSAKYIRVTFYSVLGKGFYKQINLPTFDVPFERCVPYIKINTSSFEGIEPSLNLLNTYLSTKGKYLSGSGSLTDNDVYDTSNALNVTGGKKYYFSWIRFVEQYDKEGFALEYTDLSNIGQPLVLKTDTKFIRVTYQASSEYRAMVKLGDKTEYIPYSVNIPFIRTNTRFSNKKMVCFGDSITASIEEREKTNWCMYVSEALDILTTNVGIWSARAASVGAEPVKNAFSLPKLVDSILSGDWSEQDIVYQTAGYEQHAQQLDKLKVVDFSTIDYVSISLGTNDLSSNNPFEIESEPLTPNSINGAFRYAISKLLAKYPHLKFIITTPIYRFEPLTGEDYYNNGRGIQDFVDDYIELGKELKVPVINLFNDISVNKYNKDYYWGENGGDGLHPNWRMKELMGSKIAGGLNAIL